jgi:hypothetical protein
MRAILHLLLAPQAKGQCLKGGEYDKITETGQICSEIIDNAIG